MEVITFVLLCCLLLLLLRGLFKFRGSAEFINMVEKIPGPQAQPIFGNTLQFQTTATNALHKTMPKLFRKYGPVFRFWMFSDVKVVLCKAEDALPILQGRAHIHKSGSYHYLAEYTGNTAITASGQKWHTDRKLLNPIFSRNNLLSSLPIMHKHVHCLSDTLRKLTAQVFVIHEEVHDCVSDIVYESFLGYKKVAGQSEMNKELCRASMSANKIMAQRAITALTLDWVYALHPLKKQMERNRTLLNNYADKVIVYWKDRLKKLDEDNANINEFGEELMLSLKDLILAHGSGESKIEEELRDQIKNIITAAVETTSFASSNVLFMLGLHPDLQEKVYQEVNDVIGDTEPTAKQLSELSYMDRFIKETLRIYPVVPFLERHTMEKAKLENYEVPAGCDVIVSIYHLHRDPEVWPDPEAFDPDRFLPENCKNRHPYAYLPFSVGARNCIGQAFAIMTMKVVLSAILRDFRVESAVTRAQLKTKFRLLMYPDSGHPVRIFERNPRSELIPY